MFIENFLVKIIMTKYHVYIYNSKKGVAYYVGKGKRYRFSAAYAHAERGIPLPKRENIQVFYFDTESDAFAYEKELIAFFGRRCDGGTLMNKAIGGTIGARGYSWTAEQKQARSGAGNPMYGKFNELHHNAKTFKATCPDGRTVEGTGLRQFALDEGLNYISACAVARGQRNHTGGYKITYVS